MINVRYCRCSSTWLSVNSIDLNPVTAFKCMNSSFPLKLPLKLQIVGKHYNIIEEWRVIYRNWTNSWFVLMKLRRMQLQFFLFLSSHWIK